ncbi:MAG: metal ABC transporter substrate-binding protein [Ignavibacteriaceae bacterium]
MKKIFFLILILVQSLSFANIKVVTTTTVIYDLVKEIGKDKVSVDYIARGDQDPHFVEVLPSYMMKLRKADLLFKIGMGLEMWATQLIDGSRNNNLQIIDLSNEINKKEVPSFKPDASYGDVHPYGNPHYWLDPENIKIMAKEIYENLAGKDNNNADFYKKNYEDYINKLNAKITDWNKKMSKLKDDNMIFFHASWTYFADRYGLKIAGYVEPKPGISPSPSHNADLVKLIKSNNIKVIVMENFYSDSAPKQLSELTGAKVIKVPTSVFGMQGIDSYIQMMDYIINQLSNA